MPQGKNKAQSSESSLEANATRIKAKLIFVVETGFEEGKVLAKYNKNNIVFVGVWIWCFRDMQAFDGDTYLL